MSKQSLEPDEIEEETHIITERIIEEPSEQEQEGSLFEEYVIKGAGFALGAGLFLMTTTGVFVLILEGEILSTIFAIVLALVMIGTALALIEQE